jgi:glycosyltransferase involved in cell wall biosynthesis
MSAEMRLPVGEQSGVCRLPITVIVATKNEEANIARCLVSLAQAHRVLVVDSGSTDLTQVIARQHGAEVIHYVYAGGYPKKRQWALDKLDISTPWTMLIDADEQVPGALWNEIDHALNSGKPCTAYLVRKGFHFLGKRFRFGGFSHLAIMLFRTGHARFEETAGNSPNGQDMEVHERLAVDGRVGRLRVPLIHDDCKGLAAYIDRHNKYSSWEAGIRAHYLKTNSWGERTIKASMFGDAQSFRRFVKPLALRLPFEPLLWFLYHYVFCGAVFEGRRGYIASSLRRAYIEQVRAKVYELRLLEVSSSPVPSESEGSAKTDPRLQNP